MIRPISTFALAPWLAGSSNAWRGTDYMLAAAVGAVELATKHYGRVTIYCDTAGADALRGLVDADLIVSHDHIHDTIPTDLWAAAKMATYTQQRDPYLHFDLDVLMFDPLPDRVISAPVGVQVLETTAGSWYDVAGLLRDFVPPSSWDGSDLYAIRPPNVGVLAMSDMQINAAWCWDFWGWVRANADRLKLAHQLPHSCLLEQHLLGVVCAWAGIKPEPLLSPAEPPISRRYAHFVGNLKTDTLMTKLIDRWRTPDVLSAARALDEQRSL